MAISRLDAETTTTSPPRLPDLMHQLTGQLTTLLRQELALARTELFQSLARLLSSVGTVAAGAALLYTALWLMIVAALCGLALIMPIWLAALGLGVLTGGVGMVLVSRGRRLIKRANLAPSRLPHSLRRDKDVLLRKVHP